MATRKKKKPTRAELVKAARAEDRARLDQLRRAIVLARGQKKGGARRATTVCRAARERTKEWAKLERQKARDRIAARKAADRSACVTRKEVAGLRGLESIRRAVDKLEAERDGQAANRAEVAAGRRARAAGRRPESEHEVTANLSPDELIVWAKVRGKIKGTKYASRYEKFTEWMAEHRGDVQAILNAEHEKAAVELEREHDRLMRELEREARYKGATAGALATMGAPAEPISYDPADFVDDAGGW